MGARLLLGKSNFDIRRLVGLALFWLGALTLAGHLGKTGVSIALFDVHPMAIEYLDVIPTITLCIGIILFSLYLLFHISYAQVVQSMGKNAKRAYQKQVEVLNSLGPDPKAQKKLAKMKEDLKKEKEFDKFAKKQEELESKIEKLKKNKESGIRTQESGGAAKKPDS